MSHQWWGISAERDARNAEQRLNKLYRLVVEVGEGVLREFGECGGSEEVTERLSQLVKDAYKHLGER